MNKIFNAKNTQKVFNYSLPTNIMEVILFPPESSDEIPKEIKDAIDKFFNRIYFIHGSIFSNIYWKEDLKRKKIFSITISNRNSHLLKYTSREELRSAYPESVPFDRLS